MTKKGKLILIVDNSGSMGEASKFHIAENLIKFINESICAKTTQFDSFIIYLWSDEIVEKNYDSNNFSLSKCSGKANLDKLTDFLKKEIYNEPLKAILLTDWSHKTKNKNNFKLWLKSMPKLSIKIIQIEIGKTELHNDKSGLLFHPQNIYGVINTWI